MLEPIACNVYGLEPDIEHSRDVDYNRGRPVAATLETKSVTLKIDELFGQEAEMTSLVKSFLEMQTIFPEEIQGIYYIPDKFVSKESGFSDRINIVVSIRGLSLLGYLSSASKENKSLIDYWNDSKTQKDRFWSVRTTKLLLTLNQIQAASQLLSIWVQGFSSICSVAIFSDPKKLYYLHPETMYNLVR